MTDLTVSNVSSCWQGLPGLKDPSGITGGQRTLFFFFFLFAFHFLKPPEFVLGLPKFYCKKGISQQEKIPLKGPHRKLLTGPFPLNPALIWYSFFRTVLTCICSSVHESRLTDLTLDICTPRLRCIPAHLMHKNIPRFHDAHLGPVGGKNIERKEAINS